MCKNNNLHDAPHPKAADHSHARQDGVSSRILVVDDNEDNRNLLDQRLTAKGYAVAAADGGQSALRMIAEDNFDLVLLDIMMPDMDGLETLKRIRKFSTRGTLPVIMVSGMSESEDIVQALEMGANDYISKPINFPVAFARIDTHLTLKRADNALRNELDTALERLQAATKLRESEEFTRLITDNLPVMIGYFDANKVVRFINQVGVEWYDRPRDDLIGKPLTENLTGADAQQQEQYMQQVLAGVAQTFDSAVTFPDGIFREVTISYVPHFASNGAAVGFFCIVQDITQRKAIERQFNQAQKMDAIGQLTGGIAHDFNNILMVTDGYTRRALKHLDEPEAVREALEEVLVGADRAAQLTKQLLSFSRRQIMEKRAFRVEQAVREIESLLRQSTGEIYSIDIVSSAGPICVETDASEFQQALLNLVINARDAMPVGGRIAIAIRLVEFDEEDVAAHPNLAAGRYVEISVSDNGSGIEDETAAHIFEPFFTTKDQGKGTGLGLAMVYGFAQSSGGTIEVDTAPGDGATFKIYLPAVDRDPQDLVAEVDGDHLGRGETILLVEDDPALLEIVREMLDTLGYRVITASDGFEAIEAEADYDGVVDLLLSDVVMPNMGGFEAAEIIRTARPDIKVAFMSGYPNRAGINNENLPENCQFLQKPVKPVHLARTVRQELDKPGVGKKNHCVEEVDHEYV